MRGKALVKKVLNIAGNVLLWIVLGACVILTILSVLSKIGGKKGMSVFGLGLYQIVSGSMEPEIHIGDVLVGQKVDISDVRVGQNLIFYDEIRQIIITHKVIEVRENSVITHGIANPDGANETVLAQNIIGVQRLRLPWLGYALDFLRAPAGFFLVVLVPLGGLVAYQTFAMGKRLKEYRAEKAQKEIAANTPESEQMRAEIAALKKRLGEEAPPSENEEIVSDNHSGADKNHDSSL